MPRSYTLPARQPTSANPNLPSPEDFPQPKYLHQLGLSLSSLLDRHESNLPKNPAPGDDEARALPRVPK